MQCKRLEFNEAEHAYFLDGESIPSVTTILGNVGLYPDFSFVDEWYAKRGTMVHKACHYLDKGTLDRGKLVEQDHGGVIVPFIESYEKFLEVYSVEVNGSEIRVFDEDFWFAGTFDKECVLSWHGQQRQALLDLKCGQPEFGYHLQLAGYSTAEKKQHSHLRFGVYLDKNGKLPKVIEYDKRSDFDEFKAACVVYHAKNRKGKK